MTRVHACLAVIAAAFAAVVISGCITGEITAVRARGTTVYPLSRLRLAWQPGPFRPGGTLTIAGEQFTSGSRVELTVENCSAYPYQLYPATSTPFRTCTPGTPCASHPGGQFQISVPCSCGGFARVVAVDEATGIQSSASLPIACY